MKLLTNIVSISNKSEKITEFGSWNKAISVRKRKGLHFETEYVSSSGAVSGNQYRRGDAILTDAEMWQAYRRCVDVRASIDSIVRRVATFNWMVVPKISPQDKRYDGLLGHCEDITYFLNHPNKNGDTWQEIMTAVLTDCLVFDAGVLELVYDSKRNLKELVPLRGSTVYPIITEHGKLKEYIQNVYSEGDYYGVSQASANVGTNAPKFKPNQILFLSCFKNTSSPAGNPIIETLVNEIIAMLRAAEHAMLTLDADEIPPGILVLAGIAGRAAEQAKADLEVLKGQDHKIRVMTTPDPTGMGAQWLELKRTPKDLSMREIIDDIRRAIYRAFGVMPVEMGMTSGMPKSTATVQMDVASSHLVTPILELLQARINSQILPALIKNKEILKLIEFKFDRDARLTATEQKALADTHSLYITHGILTRNEVRESLGLRPVEGGDIATIESPIGPVNLKNLENNDVLNSVSNNEEKLESEVYQDYEDKE